MAIARVSISAVGYDEWRRLARSLRGAPKDLRASLRKQIVDAGQPVLADVKQAARSIPVTSSRGGGGKRRQTYSSLQVGRRAHAAGRDVAKAALRAGRRSGGLRNRIASSAKLQIRARGIRFVIDASSLPESQRSLPRHLDSPKGWRHPVFGDRENWVHQQGKPYFAATISRKAPEFRRAILNAISETQDKIQK
ncbi:hypothetical protein ABZ342_44550 [Amycolatopsis sp. NPDC005961]|uniref:hypothetical protein n=1 Tax=Amycolatopsis sp. NPDC005961 TaxID=3156720 RepID=UPI0033CFA6A5